MKYFIVLVLTLTMTFSCKKESVIIYTFSESLIGKWELREAVDRINYQDEEWHDVREPYLSMNFAADSSFVRAWDCTNLFTSGTYEVSNQDSLIKISDPGTRTIKPLEYNGRSFIHEFLTDEGTVKHKYFKVE